MVCLWCRSRRRSRGHFARHAFLVWLFALGMATFAVQSFSRTITGKHRGFPLWIFVCRRFHGVLCTTPFRLEGRSHVLGLRRFGRGVVRSIHAGGATFRCRRMGLVPLILRRLWLSWGRALEYRRPSICGQECLCDHLPRRLTELASLPLKQGLECFPR